LLSLGHFIEGKRSNTVVKRIRNLDTWETIIANYLILSQESRK